MNNMHVYQNENSFSWILLCHLKTFFLMLSLYRVHYGLLQGPENVFFKYAWNASINQNIQMRLLLEKKSIVFLTFILLFRIIIKPFIPKDKYIFIHCCHTAYFLKTKLPYQM